MKATRPTDLKALLAQANARPSRRLGQNFLIDENIARIAIDAAALTSGEQVLEIGPGAGALTEGLLERGVHVLAVEKDERLATLLQARWGDENRIEVRLADALDLTPEELLRHGAIQTVISNLPYSSGTRILVSLVTAAEPPQRIVATLQTEVAQRIAADPGCPEYGLLAIWVQRLYRIEILRKVSATCFYPAPEVESTLFRLSRRISPLAGVKDPKRFLSFTRWVFQYRRKQMSRILSRLPATLGRLDASPAEWLERLQISPQMRPGDLPVKTWALLSNALSDPGS